MKTFALLLSALPTLLTAERALIEDFRQPPPATRPYVWWHWMGSNFSLDGITKDLEAMAASGIGGATIFNLTSAVQETQAPTADNPWPEQTYRSPAYWKAIQHATTEAKRLGLEVGLHNTVGYSTTGGPWITEERGIQKLIWRVTDVEIPQSEISNPKSQITIPRPDAPRYSGYGSQGQIAKSYQDIGILAFPVTDGPIPPESIIDLTDKLGKDEQLRWTPPTAGKWRIQRIGHAPTGFAPHPVPDDLIGKVLEADKINLEQTRHHWENVLKPIATELGSPVGAHLKHFLIDSYEAGPQSWTPGLREEFKKRLGYDPLRWLLTRGTPLTDDREAKQRQLVGSEEMTARFEHDFRTLISDLFYERGWKPAAEMIRKAGATLQFEPYTGPFDTIEGAALADLPIGEFWTGGSGGIDSKIVAAARAAGRRVIGAEAFTGRPEISQWTETPGFLKLSADGTYGSGVNHMILHHWVHQPFEERYQPGMGMGWWGTHFGRNQTWAEPGKAFYHYLWRVQALLQRGETPASHLSVGTAEAGGDAISWRAFRHDITVRDGEILTPAGRSYPLLHIPHKGALTPADLERIATLLKSGATIVSPRPHRAQGLSGYPESDQQIRTYAEKIWGTTDPAPNEFQRVSNGRLLGTGDLQAARRALGLRNFHGFSGDTGPRLSHHHRRENGSDWIFVANLDTQPRTFDLQLVLPKNDRRKPEFWNPETLATTSAPDLRPSSDSRHALPLTLGPGKSIFVALPALPSHGLTPHNPPGEATQTLALTNPWRIEFNSPVDQIPAIEMNPLTPLHEHPQDAVRHFAGTATYHTTFDSPETTKNTRLFLDLGQVEALARVTLNGKDLGVLWHPPFRVEITDHLKPGTNNLAIAVTTTWHNRLVGDEQHPADFEWGKDRGPTMGRALAAYPDWFLKNQPRPTPARKAFVNWFYHRPNTPLRPAGLLGSVELHTHPQH